jgi:hypothetical protein
LSTHIPNSSDPPLAPGARTIANPADEDVAPSPPPKKRLDERFSWSFAGVLLALGFGGFALYTWLHTKQPEITFEIEAETDVLDLRTPLPDLTIFFKGEDLRAKDLNLRVLTIRISNKGDLDLLEDQYEQRDDWGFSIRPGRVVNVRTTSSNSNYLETHINPRLTEGSDRIILEKSIFERQKWVLLDVLVIHSKSTPPELFPFGKIAGVDSIPVLKPYLTKEHETLRSRVTNGTLLVHCLRFLLYLAILIAIIAITASSAAAASWVIGN